MVTKELYIYGSAFGLPSLDANCLALIAYLNIVSYGEYNIIACNDVALSPTGELPMLYDGKNWIAGTNRVIAYLSKIGHNADKSLSQEMRAKSVSCQALADETLSDALLFSWFADDENFVGIIRKAYSNLLPFPARYYAPIDMKKRAVRRVQKYGGAIGSSGSLTHAEHTKIYDAARDCYRVLDRRLAKQDFFLGDSPTTLDAKVFGYLALQLYPEIPNPRLQMILTSQFPRLAAYCDRCRDRFLVSVPSPTPLPSIAMVSFLPSFTNPLPSLGSWSRNNWLGGRFFKSAPPAKEQGESQQEKDKDSAAAKSLEQRDFERKRIFAVGLGFLAMVGYVIANGLVVIGTEDDEDGGGGYYGDEDSLTLEEVVLLSEDVDEDD
ncbi:hypothetical protein BGZ98_003389 [Dissophora globulifera]|nr:hypothetical protein BGZ98_003389 [Dissophora globulifera]